MNRLSWFESHPRMTLIAFLVGIFVIADLALGSWFCPRIVGETDAFYHHDLPPGFNGEKEWGPLRYQLQTNSLGFKDDQTGAIPLRADRHRILIMGDSFTEGVGCSHAETFASRFEQLLRERGVAVDVQNAGVLSYSPKLYYNKVRYLLHNAGLKFDELIVFIDMTDIQDEVRYVTFTPTGDFGISTSYLVNFADAQIKQHSFTYFSLRRLYQSRHQPAFEDLPLEDLVLHDQEFLDNWSIDRIGWAFSDDLYRQWGEKGVHLALRHMDALYQLCRENDIRMNVAIFPWPRQILERRGIDLHVRTWTDFCAQRGIPLLNYFPLFAEQGAPVEVLRNYYIPGDVHWSRGGHHFVAEKLTEFWLRQERRH